MHNNQPKQLEWFERMEVINNGIQNWTIIKMPKIENGKRK